LKVSISGVRGIFGNDLSLNDIIYYCRNFSRLIKLKKCVVACDTRPSSNMLCNVAIASLMERGVAVYNLGVAPTPEVFRESRKYGAGLIITSSHNPLEWNGLKFIVDGRGIIESELEYMIKERPFPKEKIGTELETKSDYLEEVVGLIGSVKAKPRIALDVGGGAAFKVAPQLLKRIGCKIRTINEKPGESSRGPDPTYDKLLDLVRASKRSDIGFAFDLDGDRLVVVKDGKKQASDVTLGLGIAKVLEMRYKKFVLGIDTSVAIEKFINDEGGHVERSKVGEANVVDLMIRTNSQAGGEGSSAGFILPKFNMCRDGLLTSGLIASMVGTKQFNDMMRFMEGYYQLRSKIKVDSRFHKKTMQILSKRMRERFSEMITLDGIKCIIDDSSWALVRESNTEHIMRISVESNNSNKAKSIQKQVSKLVNQSYEQARRSRNH